MFVTKKTLAKELKNVDSRIEWWIERYREQRDKLWQLEERHKELLEHLGLTQERVDAHYETRKR